VTNDELRELRTVIDRRFDTVDQRFDAVDQRFDAVDRRFDAVEQRLDAHDQRFVGLDRTVTAIALRFERLERVMYAGFTAVDRRFGEMTGHFDRVYGWLEKLEQERIVSNELMKRLERRQDEIGEAVRLLPQMSETLACLADSQARLADQQAGLADRQEGFAEQQAAMAAILRRLEARS
jgi:hypothetical protein